MALQSWRIETQQLEGASARIFLAESDAAPWIGILSQCGQSRILVDLANAPEVPLNDTPVQVEVFHRGGLYRFASTGACDPVFPFRISLAHPDQILAVQRRAHPRIHFEGDVLFWWMQGDRIIGREVGRAVNLSISGLAFEVNDAPPVGTRIHVQFREAPGRHLGTLEADVVRVGRGTEAAKTVAVVFRNLPSRAAGDLFQIVHGRLRMEIGFQEAAFGFLE